MLQSSHDDKDRKLFDLLSLLCLPLFSDMLYTVKAFQQVSLEGQILKINVIIYSVTFEFCKIIHLWNSGLYCV